MSRLSTVLAVAVAGCGGPAGGGGSSTNTTGAATTAATAGTGTTASGSTASGVSSASSGTSGGPGSSSSGGTGGSTSGGACPPGVPAWTLALDPTVPAPAPDPSQTYAALPAPASAFLNSMLIYGTAPAGALGLFTVDAADPSPNDSLGFSVHVQTTDALAGGFLAFTVAAPPPGAGPDAGLDALGTDLENGSDPSTNASLVVFLQDGLGNLYQLPGSLLSGHAATDPFELGAGNGLPLSASWMAAQTPLTGLSPALPPADAASFGFLVQCPAAPCTADFHLDAARYLGGGATAPLWSTADVAYPAPSGTPWFLPAPPLGSAILSTAAGLFQSEDFLQSQSVYQALFAGPDAGAAPFAVAIEGDMQAPVASAALALADAGIPSVYYQQLGSRALQTLGNHDAFEVGLESGGEAVSPRWQSCFFSGWDCLHTYAFGSPDVDALLNHQVSALAALHQPLWLLIDYTFPYFDGAAWGASPWTGSAFRADLTGTDLGLGLTDGCATIHFWDYFQRYNGFVPVPADVGLAGWDDFAVPAGWPSTGPNQDVPTRLLQEIYGDLMSYEWLKLADRTGRKLQALGGQGVWVMPNAESSLGSMDLVFAARAQGVRGLFPEYFGNLVLEAEAAYAGLAGELRPAAAGKALGLTLETGTDAYGAPYLDWRTAFATAYALTAAGTFDDYEDDAIHQPYNQASAPTSSEYPRFQDALAKGFAFRLAHADGARRPPASLLAVSERPPQLTTAASTFYELSQTHGFQKALARAHLRFDLRDSLDLETVAAGYDTIAYAPWQMRVGDAQVLLAWLQAAPGRTLLVQGFGPTHGAPEASMNLVDALDTPLGSYQLGATWGLGNVVATGQSSVTLQGVDPSLDGAASAGQQIDFGSPLTQLDGGASGTVLLSSSVGPLVTVVPVGQSQVVDFAFSPTTSGSDAVDDPNQPWLTAVIAQTLAAVAGVSPEVAADGDTAVQLFALNGGGDAVLAWDRPTAQGWQSPYQSATWAPLQFAQPQVSHGLQIPVAAGATSVTVYDFWTDAVSTVPVQNGAVALQLQGALNGFWYVLPPGADQSCVARAQAVWAELHNIGCQ